MKLVVVNKILGSAVALLAAGSMVACNQKVKAQGPQKVVITAQAQMDAEELAQAGEQLISPTTFHLADKVFKMVLEKDPRNQKAKMYRAALKQFMVQKGILARVRPLYIKNGNEKDYTKLVRETLRESPVKYWLLDGKEDIQTYEQIQTLMVESRSAAEDFRKFLLANPNLDLTIYMNEFVFRSAINQSKRDCSVVENSESSVVVTCDTDVNAARRKMNSADVVMLRQMLAGQVLYMTMLNSHSLAGLEDLVTPLTDIGKREEDGELTQASAWQEKLKVIDAKKELGKLRKDHSFGLLPSIGADFKGAVEWALKFQAELCPKGSGAINRKGFLFEQGVCIKSQEENDSANKILAYMTQALSAQGIVQIDEVNEETGEKTKVRAKAFAWAKTPILDIHSVLPAELNECGNGKKWRDGTLGGLLPDGDADSVINSECEK